MRETVTTKRVPRTKRLGLLAVLEVEPGMSGGEHMLRLSLTRSQFSRNDRKARRMRSFFLSSAQQHLGFRSSSRS